jgi:hypothetical protein
VRKSRRICMPTSTLPALAYTRMRGDTIVSLELTQIGVKKDKRTQNQIRFARTLIVARAFTSCSFVHCQLTLELNTQDPCAGSGRASSAGYKTKHPPHHGPRRLTLNRGADLERSGRRGQGER